MLMLSFCGFSRLSECHASAVLTKKGLKKDECKSWLQKDGGKFQTKLCVLPARKASIDLNVMGESALVHVSHVKVLNFVPCDLHEMLYLI